MGTLTSDIGDALGLSASDIAALPTIAQVAKAAVPVASVATQLIEGDQTPKYEPQVANIAGTQAQEGNQLIGDFFNTGNLTPTQQAVAQAQMNALLAAIQQKYANAGDSGSTAELQDEAAARELAIQKYQLDPSIANLNAGLQLLQQGAGNYTNLATANAKDNSVQTANLVKDLTGQVA